MNAAIHLTYKIARRIAIAVVGSSVIIVGIVMIFTPGPALVVIPAGLAILGLEFTWARLWLRKVRKSLSTINSNNRNQQIGRYRRY